MNEDSKRDEATEQDDEEDLDEDDDEDEEDEYEESAQALLAELLGSFTNALEDDDSDLIAIQDAVVRFAAMAAHIQLYQLVAGAIEQKMDAQEVALSWIQDNIKIFTDYLTNQDLLRATGMVLGAPELNLRFDRKFRRRLRDM